MTKHLTAKKNYGQHFLHDKYVINKIVKNCDISIDDMILEIGPGKGHMTDVLASLNVRIIAIEIDKELIDGPLSKYGSHKNIRILEGDANKIDLSDIFGINDNFKLVSNLPYNSGTNILTNVLTGKHRPIKSVVMLQREVARNIVGWKGHLGILGAFYQSFSEVKLLFNVGKKSFRPAPKVISSVIKIDLMDNPLIDLRELMDFRNFIYNGFTSPRKQLHNSLGKGLNLLGEETKTLILKSNIDYNRRPSTLTSEEWVRIFNNYMLTTRNSL